MEDTYREIFRAFVGTAFRNGELIRASPDDPRVAALIGETDWMLAVWPYQPDDLLDGFQFVSVRGWDVAKRGGNVRTNAIPRMDRESALALQARYGGPADFASNHGELCIRPRPTLRVVRSV